MYGTAHKYLQGRQSSLTLIFFSNMPTNTPLYLALYLLADLQSTRIDGRLHMTQYGMVM